MKIVNLISIDIESAAASEVANNAAKTRLEFDLFDLALSLPFEIVTALLHSLLCIHNRQAMFFVPDRPRTK